MVTSRARLRPVSGADAPHSAATLARLLDAAPLGMLVTTLEGLAVYSNPAFAELLGHRPQPGQAFGFVELIADEGRVAARLQLDRLLRGEIRVSRGEHQLRHADGHAIWVMAGATLLPSTAETPALILVQLTSIELQKRAEEALVYSESRWNSALESARQGVWDYDMRKDRMFYSHMWRVLRGIPDDEVIGEDHDVNWLDRIHPDDRERARTDSKKQGLGVEGYDTLEYREMTRQGQYIWILSRGKPIEWDEHGKVLRSVGIDTDITHLKVMEQELAAEKERLRVTLEAMADGMISTDIEGRVVFMNPAGETLTAMRAADAVGKKASEVFRLRNESGQTMQCPVEACLERATQVRADDDSVLCAHDGRQLDIRCTASPVLGEGGVLPGVVLVFQDVTQSRALQRQLAYSAAHDDLTGLPNRAAFERALNDAIASSRGGHRAHCLIYLDLDRFKPVNDTAGHAAGDALLRQVAQTIKGVCRSHDMAARIGGDEFAVMLDDCLLENGRLVAEKIVRAIGALVFSWVGRTYSIGASAGVTVIDGKPASPLGFMGEADAACYAAKAQGRSRVITFAEMNRPHFP
jgi:diguanylate cyclase (GGDEF)-like protein/PAS domain S-box-containing protein